MFTLFIRLIRRFVLLLACALPALSAALAPNTGDVGLRSTLSMDVQVNQAGGACHADYRWHSVYGGCRRAVVERDQQREACGADYTGEQSRARERTQYILQATGQAANGPWGEWGAWDRSACVAVSRRKSGIVEKTIAEVLGAYTYGREIAQLERESLYSNIGIAQQDRNANTGYAVVLDRSNAQLQCLFSRQYLMGAEGGEEPMYGERLLQPGKSFETPSGHCQLSGDRLQAKIYGNCGHKDLSSCHSSRFDVSVISVSPCSATVVVTSHFDSDALNLDIYPPTTRQQSYALCS